MVASAAAELQPECDGRAGLRGSRATWNETGRPCLVRCVRTGELAYAGYRSAARPLPKPPASPRRVRDADETRRAILDAATAEFSAKGFAGARVDDIAARTATTKRMIYYYFGGKEGLYAAVLEEAYGGMRDAEAALRLDGMPPAEAMRRLVETTFDHHAAHPEFVRLVSGENIEGARTVSRPRPRSAPATRRWSAPSRPCSGAARRPGCSAPAWTRSTCTC